MADHAVHSQQTRNRLRLTTVRGGNHVAYRLIAERHHVAGQAFKESCEEDFLAGQRAHAADLPWESFDLAAEAE